MTTLVFDRLIPSGSNLYFDRLIDAVGFPTITSAGTVRDGAAITLTGTGFAASGNTVFIEQGDSLLELTVSAEGTTSITTAVLDAAGFYLTQSASIYVIDALDQQSLSVSITILSKSGEAAYAISQEFLGDGSTRAEAAPDLVPTDEIRIRNVVGGVIGDVTMTGQGAFVVPTALTSFDYAVFDGAIIGPYVTVTWGNPAASGTVPNIEGLNEVAATAAAIAAGFTLTIVGSAQSISVAAGLIAAQFPAPGATSPLGGVIEATISLGTSGVLVPAFIGQPRVSSEAERTAAGLLGDTLRYVDGLNSDIVLNQSVAAGTVVEIGTSVDIVVSSALAPDIVGENQQTADGILQAANLALDPDGVTEQYNPVYAIGTIIAQSPAADTPVVPGQLFRIVVSVGPGVVVPVSQVSSSPSKPAGYDQKRAAMRSAARFISTRR